MCNKRNISMKITILYVDVLSVILNVNQPHACLFVIDSIVFSPFITLAFYLNHFFCKLLKIDK